MAPPPLEHIELLPPPLKSVDRGGNNPPVSRSRSSAPSSETAHVPTKRATPSSFYQDDSKRLQGPSRGFFSHSESSGSRPALELSGSTLSPILKATPVYDVDEISPGRSRPRREASIAAKIALRQPSPLDLSPPPSSSSNIPYSQTTRKVSHSLIERRRREKINECLAALRETVPQCREEGERKEARAKERGRKRGRRNDEGDEENPRGGLHKLEILQGTIVYIEELEKRLAMLEGMLEDGSISRAPPRSSDTSVTPTLSTASSDGESPTIPVDTPSNRSSHAATPAHTQPEVRSLGELDTAEDSAAMLLLKFSTSPELRPVYYA